MILIFLFLRRESLVEEDSDPKPSSKEKTSGSKTPDKGSVKSDSKPSKSPEPSLAKIPESGAEPEKRKKSPPVEKPSISKSMNMSGMVTKTNDDDWEFPADEPTKEPTPTPTPTSKKSSSETKKDKKSDTSKLRMDRSGVVSRNAEDEEPRFV